jgi:hypothetical protein
LRLLDSFTGRLFAPERATRRHLRKPGSRSEVVGAVHSAIVSLVLSFNQISRRMLLKQLGCLKTDGARERMISESSDHDEPRVSDRNQPGASVERQTDSPTLERRSLPCSPGWETASRPIH